MTESRVRTPVREIEDEIRRKLRDQNEIDVDTKNRAQKVRDYWRSIAPVRSGDYAASIKLDRRRRKSRTGLPIYRVKTNDFKAHWIEYGTGEPGPTPEFACARRTAAVFAGTAGPADLAGAE